MSLRATGTHPEIVQVKVRRRKFEFISNSVPRVYHEGAAMLVLTAGSERGCILGSLPQYFVDDSVFDGLLGVHEEVAVDVLFDL